MKSSPINVACSSSQSTKLNQNFEQFRESKQTEIHTNATGYVNKKMSPPSTADQSDFAVSVAVHESVAFLV
jgi:hypothetical protein